MLPPTPKGAIIFGGIARRVAPGTGTYPAPTSRGLGDLVPVLSASCCVHTPTSRAAFSGEPGWPAKALGGKSLPWGCLGWRPNQECADTPPGSGGLLGK